MFYIIANFKSNLIFSDISKYIEVLDKGLSALNVKKEIKVIIAPSSIYLSTFLPLSVKYSFFSLAAQDVSAFNMGSNTGEVNSNQLKHFCDYCIVGHSERRKYQKENNTLILKKVTNLISTNITPIVCTSSLYEIRSISNFGNKLLVAFEPIKYIGGNVSAPTEYVNQFIVSSGLSSVIYGGSVNLDNCDKFINNPLINGLLVGGFSLNPVDFLKLIQKTNNLLKV